MLLPVRFCILLSHSSNWRQVLTVTLTSFKSTMGLQRQCTCWENTVVLTLLQSFSVPTIPFIFGFTQIMPLLLEVLLFSGILEILVSLMKCQVMQCVGTSRKVHSQRETLNHLVQHQAHFSLLCAV